MHAAHAFETYLRKSGEDAIPEVSSLLSHAAKCVDAYFESLDENAQFEQGWTGTACGVAIAISSGVASLVWLGDVQVFHVRERSIVNSLACHTLGNALREAGHEISDNRYHHVKLKWLSRRHDPDVATWMLERLDAVVVCSPYIERCLLEEQLQSMGLERLAQRVVAAANESEPRIDHTMLVLRASDALDS